MKSQESDEPNFLLEIIIFTSTLRLNERCTGPYFQSCERNLSCRREKDPRFLCDRDETLDMKEEKCAACTCQYVPCTNSQFGEICSPGTCEIFGTWCQTKDGYIGTCNGSNRCEQVVDCTHTDFDGTCGPGHCVKNGVICEVSYQRHGTCEASTSKCKSFCATEGFWPARPRGMSVRVPCPVSGDDGESTKVHRWQWRACEPDGLWGPVSDNDCKVLSVNESCEGNKYRSCLAMLQCRSDSLVCDTLEKSSRGTGCICQVRPVSQSCPSNKCQVDDHTMNDYEIFVGNEEL